MSRFVQVDRETAYLLPPSVQEWLPEGHLARDVVDVVEALDLSGLVRRDAGRGSEAHHPGTLLALLIYGYATGVHASRHRALSHGHALKLKEQLQAEVETLMRLAEAADASARPEGMDIPQERARREQRLARIEEAKARIEAAAVQHYEQARAQFEARQAERERRPNAGGRPPGPPPAPPSPAVDPQAQVNLTDADSRIMKVSGQGFEQCYHAQLAVDRESRLIVASGLTQAVNDQQQLIPALEKVRALPPELGTVQALVADSGFLSEANVNT